MGHRGAGKAGGSLLLSRDPLRDLDGLREPEAVFVAGRRVSDDARVLAADPA